MYIKILLNLLSSFCEGSRSSEAANRSFGLVSSEIRSTCMRTNIGTEAALPKIVRTISKVVNQISDNLSNFVELDTSVPTSSVVLYCISVEISINAVDKFPCLREIVPYSTLLRKSAVRLLSG
jgi:hypothetical protein